MIKTSNIYVSTACLNVTGSLTNRIKAYKSIGIKSIELGAGVEVNHTDIHSLHRSGCNFLMHNCFPPPPDDFFINLASPSEEIRSRSIDLILRSFQLAVKLRCPYFSIHAGFVQDPIGAGFHSLLFPERQPSTLLYQEAMDRFIKSIDIILRQCENNETKILVENNVCPVHLKGKLLLQTPDELEYFINYVSHPDLGILLDVGHLNVSAKSYAFNLGESYSILKKFTKAIHLHDNDGYNDCHGSLSATSSVLGILGDGWFNSIPIILEARFDTLKFLAHQIEWLCQYIASKKKVGELEDVRRDSKN